MSNRREVLIGIGGIATGCLLGLYISKEVYNSEHTSLVEMLMDVSKDNLKSLMKFNSPNYNGRDRLVSIKDSYYDLYSNHSKSNNSSNDADEETEQLSQVTTSLATDSPTISFAMLDTLEYPFYNARANYPEMKGNKSIMARYLTPEMYDRLFAKRTSYGFSLDSCIQAGLDNPQKISCGIIAGDEECYDKFAEIFDPVITDRHRGFTRTEKIFTQRMSAKRVYEAFDPAYVKSIHFLIGRCIRGFRFPPSCSRAERYNCEEILKSTLLSLEGTYGGTYHHLSSLSPEQLHSMPDILRSVAECPANTSMHTSGSNRDWPYGRGIYYSYDRKLLAWTNREDHLRVMYRVREITTLNFLEAFKQFSSAVSDLEVYLQRKGYGFCYHHTYGYLLTCPSGIGTALRAGAHMKLPLLVKDARFCVILKALRLHMRINQGLSKKGCIDIYNMDRLGFEEDDLINNVSASIHLLSKMEKRLEGGHSITDMIDTINEYSEV